MKRIAYLAHGDSEYVLCGKCVENDSRYIAFAETIDSKEDLENLTGVFPNCDKCGCALTWYLSKIDLHSQIRAQFSF